MTKSVFRTIKAFLFVCVLLWGIGTLSAEKVWAADYQVTMSSCKLNSSATKLTVKAKVKKKTKKMGKKLYLLRLNAYHSEKGVKSAKPLASVKAKKGQITFKVNYDSSMLYQKFVVAYKTKGKYQIVSDARYITNPEVLATYKGKGPATTSKKGIQPEHTEDALALGARYVVVNWTLNSILNNNAVNKTEFTYKGKRYYLDADQLRRNDELVQTYQAAGARMTVILLLPKDENSSGTKSMQYGGYSYTKFSSFKTSAKTGCETFEAVMTYLAKRYGTKENLVSGWILGNEVNSACVWNYGGKKSLSSYMGNYARAFRICYNAVKSVSKNSKVYISLDNNWNRDMDTKGNDYFSSKATLDKFYEKLKAQGNISFQIAYHAYPQGMKDPVFWDDSQATDSKKAAIINFKNIKVLTDYVKKNFGKDCTIMLSEQSFNSNKGEEVQAAAYAYAYYISEGNSMIESFIYGRHIDHPDEMKDGYQWGLYDNWYKRRLIWSVFQYIDTKDSFKFTDPLLSYTNIKKWSKISGFKKSKYTKMPSKRKKAVITSAECISTASVNLTWDKIATADGYEIFRNNVHIASIADNSIVSFTDKGLTQGTTYQYQVCMYKDASKKERLYGELSAPVSVMVTAGRAELNADKCEVNGNEIKVAWKKMSNVSGFAVYRSTEMDGNYTLIATTAGDKTSYKDNQTLSGTTYYYKVAAFVTIGGQNYYGKESAVLKKEARIQLAASIVDGEIRLNWSQWRDTLRYRVYCTPETVGDYERQKTLTDFSYSCIRYKDVSGTMVDFAVGETYCFRVRADYGNNTYSPYSNVVTVTITEPLGKVQPIEPEESTSEQLTEGTEPVETEESTAEHSTEDTEAIEPEESTAEQPSESTQSTEDTEPIEAEEENTAEQQEGTQQNKLPTESGEFILDLTSLQ